MKKTVVIIISLLILSAGIYVYYFVYNKPHPEYAELKPDFTSEASLLFQEFVANPTESSNKYSGKMIQLSGEITRIEKVDSLTIGVFVFNEGMFGDEGIRCTFLQPVGDMIADKENLKGFQIKGFCTGYNEVDVILEKCSLVK